MHALARAQRSLQGLLQAVLGITGELELPAVLRRIVRTAMDLVGARYGALGVLDEERTFLTEFVPLGLNSQELADLSGVELPRGSGLLGHLIRHPEPLRVEHIAAHPESAGFPAGHPPMRTLLGVAISVRGRVYGNLYLSDRQDGKPFDEHDEGVILALAGTAGARSRTPACTARSATGPSSSSVCCCPGFLTWTRSRRARSTGRPPRPGTWAGTGTTQ